MSALFGLKLEPRFAGPRKVLTSILHEEMVHLAIACNLKIAFGGTPYLAYKNTVPIFGKGLAGHLLPGLILK